MPSPTAPPRSASLREKVATLCVELSDLAFDLERRGRHDAADLAVSVAARLGELADAEGAVARGSSRGRASPRLASARAAVSSADA